MQVGRDYTNIRYSCDNNSTLTVSSSGIGSVLSSNRSSTNSLHSPLGSSVNSVTLRSESRRSPRAVSEMHLPRWVYINKKIERKYL